MFYNIEKYFATSKKSSIFAPDLRNDNYSWQN